MANLLKLAPCYTELSVKLRSGVVPVSLEGGLSRSRRDLIGTVSSVDVVWVTTHTGYQYLRAFYRVVALNGSQPFNIYLPLITEESILYEGVYFVPGSFGLKSKNADVYTCSAQLIVLIGG